MDVPIRFSSNFASVSPAPLYSYTLYLLHFETRILLILLNIVVYQKMVFNFDLCCFYLAECFLPFTPEGFIRTVVLQK